MMTRNALRTALRRMEEQLAAARNNLQLAERHLGDRAEAEAIRRRPKARYYHRRMSRWTGALRRKYGVNTERPRYTGP